MLYDPQNIKSQKKNKKWNRSNFSHYAKCTSLFICSILCSDEFCTLTLTTSRYKIKFILPQNLTFLSAKLRFLGIKLIRFRILIFFYPFIDKKVFKVFVNISSERCPWTFVHRYKVYFIPHQTKNLWDEHTHTGMYIYLLINWCIDRMFYPPFFRERKEMSPEKKPQRYVVGKKSFLFFQHKKRKYILRKNKRQKKREESEWGMIFIVFFSERERETAIARRESIISSLYKPKFFFIFFVDFR